MYLHPCLADPSLLEMKFAELFPLRFCYFFLRGMGVHNRLPHIYIEHVVSATHLRTRYQKTSTSHIRNGVRSLLGCKAFKKTRQTKIVQVLCRHDSPTLVACVPPKERIIRGAKYNITGLGTRLCTWF